MHREIMYVEHNPRGYEELYNSFKETECSVYSLEWFTWQLDNRFMTKEQAFDLLYDFINRYAEDVGSITLDFKIKDKR